jgi:iron complex outermembrane receptor protein
MKDANRQVSCAFTTSASKLGGTSIMLRRAALVGVSGAALSLSTMVFAQSAAPPTANSAPPAADAVAPATPAATTEPNTATSGDIVVTGTRLGSGFSAPTPVQVLDAAALQTTAAPNVFDAVKDLPALSGSRGSTVGNASTSSGDNGLSTLALRGLGSIRTLTLVNGERVTPANINGVVDVSLIPQLLIERVDVVTGGASASYGSDAVGGVVNFILNDKFTGFKANVEGGITNYGDDRNGLVQAAYGKSLMNDRLHLVVSGEYYDNSGVPARSAGDNGGPNGRDGYPLAQVVTRTIAATPAGQPEYFLYKNAQVNNYSSYGLITAGPLAGTAFGPNGTTHPFQLGTGCIGSYCNGGDNSANVLNTGNYDTEIRRATAYGRVGFDVTSKVQVFASLSYADVKASTQTAAGAPEAGNLTIQCDNAFLPQSVKTACAANNITNFKYGVSNLILPGNLTVDTHRQQLRITAGIDAKAVSIFGKSWNIKAGFEHGETKVGIDLQNVFLTPRYLAAIDAVQLGNGQIVCRSAAAQAAGCVPLNVIGQNAVNPAALAYVEPGQGPQSRSTIKQDVAHFAMNGSPFHNWAGDVSVAFGAEYRKQSYNTVADPYGNGVSASSPNTAAYPADPLLLTGGNNWFNGNFSSGSGSYNVWETFGELGIPIFNGPAVGKFDFDAAIRYTHYSTAGGAVTWKLGGVWDTPISGFRLRGNVSRDIRAPNLSELSPPPIALSSTVTNRITGASVAVNASIIGNPALIPEKSQNFELGGVYRPDWLRGLNASVDYYHIKIKDAVQTLTAVQTVDLCQISGNAIACSQISLNGTIGTANAPYVIRKPLNLALIDTDGIDFSLNYRIALGHDTSLSFAAEATRILNFDENLGIPNVAIIHAAGSNSNLGAGFTNGDIGIAPKWKGLLSQNLARGRLSLTVIERLVSKGYINPSWIQCAPGTCPVATIQNPTIDNNTIPGAIYVDVGGKYDIVDGISAYFKVDNLANKSPPAYGSPSLYDYLGRVYRVGVRVNFGR